MNTGKWEDDYGGKMFLAMERNGNSLGFASSERLKFIEKNELPIYDGTEEYCLWLGCMGSYDPQGREIVLSLAAVLRHLGVTFGVLRKEKCTGDPVRRLGNDLLFQQAEANIEQLKPANLSANVTKLLSICPHCVRTIGEDWKEFGAAFQIEHHSELLARMQEKLPRRADQRERATELATTGAAVVGTACPFRQTMFRDALGTVSQTPPKLLDIAQIAAASIESAAGCGVV